MKPFLLVVSAWLAVLPFTAHAQQTTVTPTIVHAFEANGGSPLPLTVGLDGNFYGVTQYGASVYFRVRAMARARSSA